MGNSNLLLSNFVCVCCTHVEARIGDQVSSFGPLPYWLRKGLSLNLLITGLVQSVRREALGICLTLSPKC